MKIFNHFPISPRDLTCNLLFPLCTFLHFSLTHSTYYLIRYAREHLHAIIITVAKGGNLSLSPTTSLTDLTESPTLLKGHAMQ